MDNKKKKTDEEQLKALIQLTQGVGNFQMVKTKEGDWYMEKKHFKKIRMY